jgi:hypothetical protein
MYTPTHTSAKMMLHTSAQHQTGDHHADKEGVGLAGRAEVAGDDDLAGKADELAEQSDHGDEHRRLGNGLPVQEAGNER